MKKIVAIFGPSNVAESDAVYADAQQLGRLLAEANFTVLTGGYNGIMEAVSRGAREVNGATIGVTAEVYFARGREANAYLSREIKVKSAVDRTMELLELADAYIAIGNSTGTLVEVMLAWDYMVKRFLPKKPLLLIGTSWDIFLESIPSTFPVQFVHSIHSVQEAAKYLKEFFGPSAQLPSLDILHA